MEQLIDEFEQAEDQDSTEIGRQFAVRRKKKNNHFDVFFVLIAITTNYDGNERDLPMYWRCKSK